MNRLVRQLARPGLSNSLRVRHAGASHVAFRSAALACRYYSNNPPSQDNLPSELNEDEAAEKLASFYSNTAQSSSQEDVSKILESDQEKEPGSVFSQSDDGSTDDSDYTEYPNLMTPDPLMDSRDVLEFPPTRKNPYGGRVVVRNDTSIFLEEMQELGVDWDAPDQQVPEQTDEMEEELSSHENLPLDTRQLRRLYRFPIFSRRITQQTGKGKIHRIYSMVIVGNGDGLVGLGEGKDEDSPRAEAKAFGEAVRNMDYVERFENRTIWTDMDTKLGATHLILRPRPVGFGLRCNPNLHQVLKAAGIKDISAKVWGSRNPINVIKAAFRMLQSGNAPLGMGDGIGGIGRKLNKGSGARSKNEVERERGRKLIDLRTT